MSYQIVSLFLVLSIAYFLSRIALRLGWFAASSKGLAQAHFASGLALILLVVLIKFWSTGFSNLAVVKIAGCQLLCYFYDHLRGRFPRQTVG
jgi:hypothetical protein